MSLGKINLEQMHNLLSSTTDRGLTNAVQVSWGSRDFILTDANGNTTMVKMKDLVAKFQELAGAKGVDSELIHNVRAQILDLDVFGDAMLTKESGSGTLLMRNLKNIFTMAHGKVLDEVENKLTDKETRQYADMLKKSSTFQLTQLFEFLEKDKSMLPDLKNALRYLVRNEPENPITQACIQRLPNNVDTEEFVKSMKKELQIKTNFKEVVNKVIDNQKKIDAQIEDFYETFKATEDKFIELFPMGLILASLMGEYELESLGQEHNLPNILNEMVHKNPQKAKPLIEALYENSITHLDYSEFREKYESTKSWTEIEKDYNQLTSSLLKECNKLITEKEFKSYALQFANSVKSIPKENLKSEYALIESTEYEKMRFAISSLMKTDPEVAQNCIDAMISHGKDDKLKEIGRQLNKELQMLKNK